MQVRIECNGTVLPVGPFVGRFTGNVCSAVVASLNSPQPTRHICFELDRWGVRLLVDGFAVAVDRGFAARIVGNTLRGMVRDLKGIDPDGELRIETTLESAQ